MSGESEGILEGQQAPELREALAELCHAQWSGWMKYLFSKTEMLPGTINAEFAIIPEWAVERWKRQMETRYENLTDKEKESDRAEADRILAIIAPPRLG